MRSVPLKGIIVIDDCLADGTTQILKKQTQRQINSYFTERIRVRKSK